MWGTPWDTFSRHTVNRMHIQSLTERVSLTLPERQAAGSDRNALRSERVHDRLDGVITGFERQLKEVGTCPPDRRFPIRWGKDIHWVNRMGQGHDVLQRSGCDVPPHAGWSPGLRELLSKETIEERMPQTPFEPRTGSRS